MMCSHTPDTTRPIAKPEKPLTKPPTNAASTNTVKTVPSMGGRSSKRGDEHLDGDPSGGEAAEVPGRSNTPCRPELQSSPAGPVATRPDRHDHHAPNGVREIGDRAQCRPENNSLRFPGRLNRIGCEQGYQTKDARRREHHRVLEAHHSPHAGKIG